MCDMLSTIDKFFHFIRCNPTLLLSHFYPHSHSSLVVFSFTIYVNILVRVFQYVWKLLFILFSFVSALMAMHNYWGLFQSTDEHLSVEAPSQSVRRTSVIIANEEWKQYKFKTVSRDRKIRTSNQTNDRPKIYEKRERGNCILARAHGFNGTLYCTRCYRFLFRIWTVRWNACLL